MIALIVIVIAVAAVMVVGFVRTVRIVPQARAYVVERLGSYSRTLDAGLNTVTPFIDRVRARVDLREQVVSFAPQPVITEDNVTTLRNVIGGLDLERTLTSREQINGELRGVLDEATGKWGIRVNRVELKAIDPPGSIKDAMEKQLRAAILTAEGSRQSQILTAEGAKQGAILTAEGERQAQILIAQGQAEAIGTVFEAIHLGRPDPELLAYQHLQTLPKIASGDGNHTWLIPSELTRALDALAAGFGDRRTQAAAAPAARISAPDQVTSTTAVPLAPLANRHTGRTGGRGSKRTAGTQHEGEADRLSAGRSTPGG